nr:hypothetical protein [Halorubrum ezzemoulense]
MFDGIPISMLNELKSIPVFSENRSEVVCVIEEKFYVIELIATV